MIIGNATTMDMLMAYYFAFREGRLRDRNRFFKVRQEIRKRAEGCIVVYKEKRA